MASRKNPIERRLDKLNDLWVEFAEQPDARVLCLLYAADEPRMVDAFVAMESDERAGTLPDLFVELKSPFDAASPYGYVLAGEFEKLAEKLHAGLESPETPVWAPPPATRAEDDVSLWVRTCESFRQHYAMTGHFAAVLRSGSVSDAGAYQLWLQRFVAAAPPNVRAIVLDDAKAPALAPLVQAEPIRVVAKPLALDMPGARLELSREAGGLDTPGGKFRHLFVKLGNALGEQKLPEALALGQAALTLAAAQGWWHLMVPVHCALAAGLAGAERLADAVNQYQAAEAAALRGQTEAPEEARPVCKTLRLQARLGTGSALIAGSAWTRAAQHYRETAPLAAEAGDQRALLDCHRLASFCEEQAGNRETALKDGMAGLEVAKQMDAETRATSSFPYLGEGLLRVAAPLGVDAQVEREIVVVAGTRDWRPKPIAAGASPA